MKFIYAFCLTLAIVGAGVTAFCLQPGNAPATDVVVGIILVCFVGFIMWFAELLGKEVTRG